MRSTHHTQLATPESDACEPSGPAIQKKTLHISNMSMPERIMQRATIKLACRRHRPDCFRDGAADAGGGSTRTGCLGGMAHVRRRRIAAEKQDRLGEVGLEGGQIFASSRNLLLWLILNAQPTFCDNEALDEMHIQNELQQLPNKCISECLPPAYAGHCWFGGAPESDFASHTNQTPPRSAPPETHRRSPAPPTPRGRRSTSRRRVESP